MLTVRTNGLSLLTQTQLSRSNNCVSVALERLSTGFRINKAKDDAANLAISKNMSCQISGTEVANENVQQGMNLLDVADGALDNIAKKIGRIRDLSLQSMNGTYSDAERQMMQQEVSQLVAEIYREKETTAYNKIKLFEENVNSISETLSDSALRTSGGGNNGSVTALDNSARHAVSASFETKESGDTELSGLLRSARNDMDMNNGDMSLRGGLQSDVVIREAENANDTTATRHAELVSASQVPVTLNQVQGDVFVQGDVLAQNDETESANDTTATCHAELVSASQVPVTLNQVQGDVSGGVEEISALESIYRGLPVEFQQVEYLENTGNQYINTGIYGNQDTRVLARVQVTEKCATQNGHVIGAAISYNDRTYELYTWGDYFQTHYNFSDNNVITSQADHTYSIDKNANVTTITDENTGVTKSVTQNYGIFTTPYEMYLLTIHRPSGAAPSYIRLFDCKIYENGDDLSRDFVPCYRKSDGEAGMYDMVTGQFFTNQGTGEFKVGADVPDPPPPPPPPPPVPAKVDLQVGANSGENNMLSVTTGFSLNGFSADISTIEKASETLDKVDALAKLISEKRATIGSARNRLDSVSDSQAIRLQNLYSSHSTIVDTDFASETAKLTKNQILQNVTASLLTQANSSPLVALKLLG